MSEGYIKFNTTWHQQSVTIPERLLERILHWRDACYRLGMVGAYEDGTGFGNLSAREAGDKVFYITGTATGNVHSLSGRHLARVDGVDIRNNRVECTGEVCASAESLTHAAIYEADETIGGVIHLHHLRSWEVLLNRVPATGSTVAYGTPEMAAEVFRVFQETDVRRKKVMVMAGHREGFITFGKDLDEAGAILLSTINQIKS